MPTLNEMAGKTLWWDPVGWFTNEYALRDGENILARISPAQRLGFRIPCEFEAEGIIWTYTTEGIIFPDNVITRQSDAVVVARYHNEPLGKGRFKLLDGRIYSWKPANFMMSEYMLVDEKGSEIVRYG